MEDSFLRKRPFGPSELYAGTLMIGSPRASDIPARVSYNSLKSEENILILLSICDILKKGLSKQQHRKVTHDLTTNTWWLAGVLPAIPPSFIALMSSKNVLN